jgi:hypothetical protein
MAESTSGLAWYQDKDVLAGINYSMGGFQELAAGYSLYGAGKASAASYGVQAASMEVEAEAVELQAAEVANALRQKFLGLVGNAEYSAAVRGVAVDSGSVQSNLERSSENLDKDISTINRNAAMKAKTLRTNAKVAKGYEKAYSKTAGLMQFGTMASGLGHMGLGAGLAFGRMNTGGTTPYGTAIDPGQVASANNLIGG